MTCPSENGNSSEICLNGVEICCDYECVKLNESCPGFSDDNAWMWSIFAIASLTDIAQIFIVIWYRRVFYYRMTWTDDNEGFCHRNFITYYEKFVDYIFCQRIGRLKYRGQNLDDVVKTDRLGLWVCLFFSLALGFTQRLLDLPYLNMSVFRVFLGDGCNYLSTRQLTKPIEFYLLFLLAELYGLWAFWYCVHKLKKDIEKVGVDLSEVDLEADSEETQDSIEMLPKFEPRDRKARKQDKQVQHKCNLNYFSDDVRTLVFLSTGEIPITV